MIIGITPSGKEIKDIYKIEFYSPKIIFVNDDIIVKEIKVICPECNKDISLSGNETNTIRVSKEISQG